MKKYYEDKKYLDIVDNILNNEKFLKLENIKHHGINRLNHSIRVSYNSYRITKLLKLNYKSSARAGLLHDFFLEDNSKLNKKEKLKVLFKHPKYAYDKSNELFEISNLEKDIITTHMFPIGKNVPKYAESWIVDIVDDIASIYERIRITYKQLNAAVSFIFIIILNNL